MIAAQQTKKVNLTPPGALVDDASLTVAELDTLGFDYCEILLILGATDIGMTALTLTESDTAGSGHANVTAGIWGTAVNHVGESSTLPSATGDDGIFVFQIDLRKRKRYLDLTATVDDGTAGGYYTVIAILSRAKEAPQTAAEAGCAEILRL